MAVEIHEASGTIEDVKDYDNAIWFALGTDNGDFHNQKRFRVYKTEYDTQKGAPGDNPNPAAETVKRHDGEQVTLRYYTKQVKRKAGGTGPANFVTEFLSVGGNGSPSTSPSKATVSDSKPSEANTRSVVPDNMAAYIEATCDDVVDLVGSLKAAVQSMVGGGGSGSAAPSNPNAAAFLTYMESEGLSEVAINKRLEELGVGSDYTTAFDHHLTAVAESYGKTWSA